jgi:hypothetical protein
MQNKAVKQALKEEIQQLRQQNEDLAQQVRALLVQQHSHQLPSKFLQQEPRSASADVLGQVPEIQAREEANQYAPPLIIARTPPINASGTLNIPSAPAASINQTPVSDKYTTDQIEYILGKLKILEGNQGVTDSAKFCIINDLEIPKDFKVPDFEKYDGITREVDPNVHMHMYCSKMGTYLKNEKMMMYYFQ